jgi:AcrR family transcriptional regulator
VSTALALVDRDGLSALTMRRLGTELGVDPMAVYYHLPNKAALFDGLVEAVYAEVDTAAALGNADWRARIAATMRQFRQALLRHPNVVPVVGTRPVATPALFRVLQVGVAELQAAGFALQQSLDLLTCVTTYAVGQCLAEVGQPVGGETPDPEDVVRALDPVEFSLVLAAFAEYRYDSDAQFEFGLSAMLAGVPDPADPGEAAPSSSRSAG